MTNSLGSFLRAAAVSAAAFFTSLGVAVAQEGPRIGTATASNQSGSTRSAAQAIDGRLDTRWEASNSSPGSWIAVSYGQWLMNSVQITEYGNRIRGYRLEVQRNGVWTTTATGATLGSASFSFEPASSVRLVVTSSNGQPSIREIQARFPQDGYVSGLGHWPACARPQTAAQQNVFQVVVKAGQTFDGGNQLFFAPFSTTTESNPPIFILEEGATLRNVVIHANSAEEVQCLGSCRIENVWWDRVKDIGAVTAKGPAGSLVNLDCGGVAGGYNGIQVVRNTGRGDVAISRFYSNVAAPLYRSCTTCTANGGPRRVTLNNVAVRDLRYVVGVNGNFGDTANIGLLYVDNTTATPTDICRNYVGQTIPQQTTYQVEWGTQACQVQRSNVRLLGPSTVTP